MATFGPFTFPTLGSADEGSFIFSTSRTPGTTGVAASGTTARWAHEIDETPSAGVGPIGGEEGNPEGYVYTEASSPGASGDTYTMEFNKDLNGNEASTLQFYASARGTVTTSTIEVQISEDGGAFSTIAGGTILVSTFATASGAGTAPWTEFNVDLGAATSADVFRVRLVVTIQGNPQWHCDIGIDSVTVTGELPAGVARLDGWTAGPVSGADFSFPITAGNNRVVLLGVAAEGTAGTVTINSATYGGEPMTPVAAQISAGGSVGCGTRWFILDETGIAAASGDTVSVSYSNITADQVQPFIACIKDVDQTSPVFASASETSGDDGGDTPSYNISTVDEGLLVAIANSGNFDEVITFAAPLVKQAQTDATSSTASVAEVIVDGSTVAVDPSFTNVNRSTSSAVVLRPAAAGNTIDLSGTITSTSDTTGNLLLSKELSGTVDSTSTASGDILVVKDLAGTLPGVSTASGNLQLDKLLSGTSISTSTLSGDLSVEVGDVIYGNISTVNDGVDATDKTISFSHNNDGDDLLIVAMCFSNISNAATVTSTATFNGVSATSVAVNPDGLQDDIPRVEFFFLEDAASGPNTVECTFNAEDQNLSGFQVYVFSLTGVTAIGPVKVEADNGDTVTTSFSSNLDVQEAGSDIFAVMAIQNGSFSSQSITPGTGYTARTDDTNSGGGGSTNFMARAFSLTADGTGDRAVDATFQTEDTPSLVAVEFLVSQPVVLLSGTLDASSSASGSLQVDKVLSGTVPGSSVVSGDLDIDKALSGALDGTSDMSGDLDIDKALSGTLAGVSSSSGDLATADRLSGTLAGVSSWSGDLAVTKDLSGAIDGTSDLSADLAIDKAMSGSLSGTSALSGDIDLGKGLSGSLSGTSDLSADLAIDKALSGTLAGSSATAGNVSVDKDLSGAVDGTSQASGSLLRERFLSGTVPGSSALSANLQSADALSGTVVATSDVSGTISVERALSGTLAGTSDMNAALQGDKALSGTVDGTSDHTGNLQIDKAVSGTLAGTSETAANLQVDKDLSGSVDGTSDLSGDLLRAKDLSGSVAGSSDLAGSIDTDKGLSGTVAGSSVFIGDVQRDVVLSGGLSGVSDVSGIPTVDRNLSGTVEGQSSFEASLQTDDEVSGTIAGQSSVGGNISVDIKLSGSLGANSVSSSNLLISKTLSGTIASEAEIAGSLLSEDRLSGILAGNSSVSGRIDVQRNLSGSLAGSSELEGDIRTDNSLSGTSVSASSYSGSLRIDKRLSSTVSGSSDTAGNLFVARDLQGAVVGLGVVSGRVSLNRRLSGVITSEARITGGLAGETQEFINVAVSIMDSENMSVTIMDSEDMSVAIVDEGTEPVIREALLQVKVLV